MSSVTGGKESIYSPLFGVSNAYFLTNTPGSGSQLPPMLPSTALGSAAAIPAAGQQLQQPQSNIGDSPLLATQLNKGKLLADIPNLLAQVSSFVIYFHCALLVGT